MSVTCPNCAHVVTAGADGRQPPWCPKCGSDFKPKKPASSDTPGQAPVAEAPVAPAPAPAPKPAPPIQARKLPPPDPAIMSLLPPDVAHQLAELGNPEQIHFAKRSRQLAAWVAASVCFGIVALAVYQLIDPRPEITVSEDAVVGCAALFALLGAVAVYAGIRLQGSAYWVFPSALVEFQGRTHTVYKWDQIKDVFMAVHPAWKSYRVVTRKARTFKVGGDIRDHVALGERIAEEVAKVREPLIWSDLDTGRSVYFGPIGVSRAELTCQGMHLPWHQLGTMSVGLFRHPSKQLQSHMLHLRITPTCAVELGEIPNYHLFEQIVRRIYPACLPTSESVQ